MADPKRWPRTLPPPVDIIARYRRGEFGPIPAGADATPGPYGAPTPEGMGSPERGTQVSPVQFPPEVYPPPDAAYFSGDGNATGVTSAANVLVAAENIPTQTVAVIREFTINVNDMLTSTDIRWRLRQNNSPISGWDKTLFPRIAASVGGNFPPELTMVRIIDGGLIDVEIQVNDAGTYQVGASYSGWFFSKETAERYAEAWR